MDESRAEEKDIESGDLMTQTTDKTKTRTCPECGTKIIVQEGCVACKACGWALCK